MTTPEPTGSTTGAAGSTSSPGRKIAVAIGGSTVTAAGVVMLVTPGPGIVAILGGLGILGTEFPFAKRALNRLRLRKREDTG